MQQSDLLSQWKKRKGSVTTRIQARPAEALARPSAGQRRLFLLQQLYPGNPFYQYAHRYELRGKLDIDKLRESLTWLVNSQEVLRSNYAMDELEEIVMTFQPAGTFSLEQATDETWSEEAFAAAESSFCLRPFNLSTDSLFRAKLFALGEATYRLVFSMHHIIGDRGSLMILEQELFRYYTKLVAGEVLPATNQSALSFADYAYWEATREVPESHYTYWKKELSGELPYAELPYDHQRPNVNSFGGKLLTKSLSAARSKQIRQLARSHSTTPNVIFLAALNAFLYRYTGQEDILIGAPVSTRDRTEFEALVGFLNETVVLRHQLDVTQGLADIITKLKPKVETALAYKDVPFDWIVDELASTRSGGENPFFQTMFVYNGTAPDRVLPAGLAVTDQYLDLGTSKFDLSLFASDNGTHFSIGFEYATDLFQEDTVVAMLEHFQVLLDDTVNKPTDPISTCALLPPADQKQLLVDWNPTLGKNLEAPLLPQHFLNWSTQKPTAIAITDGNTALTYGELAANSRALAAKLLAEGLLPGTPVGLYCGRTTDLLVGILGIMQAGGAYVPLDPEYPTERVEMIIADAGISLLVHHTELSPPLTEQTVMINIPRGQAATGDIDLPVISPEQTAYIIYTSGSTGRPKGIPISHANLAHSTAARFAFYADQPTAFLLLSSFAFDSSVAGIFWAMANGGKLVISAPRAEQDPTSLGRLIRSEKVTHTLMLPSLYQLILEFSNAEDLTSLQVVMVAGEACPNGLVNEHFSKLPDTKLVNEYGPTEGTVWSTAHYLEPQDVAAGVPIGRPIHGVGHYVLDQHLQPVPIGVVGELYLSGPGLAQGYLGRPDLTKERFLEVNLGAAAGASQRLYKTGDLVRYRKNGLLDFIGRSDNQVKIRGHRIEPTEISKVLDKFPSVRESVVTAISHQEELALVAYYQLEGAPIDTSILNRQLREHLPAYMIPDYFVLLKEFPRLPNGKVNRKALPEPALEAPLTTTTSAPPKGEAEEKMAVLWAKVLGLGTVGRHDNFFDIGGNSLKSIRIISGAKRIGFKLAPQHLFRYPTIAELVAAVIKKAPSANADGVEYEAVIQLRKGGDLPPLFCLHSGGGHVFFYQPLAQLMDGSRSVYALQPRGLSGEPEIPTSIEEMAANYISAIREVQPHGPYCLLGTCFSNAVGVEMVHQLKAAGESIDQLIFVDSSPFLPQQLGKEQKSFSRRLIDFIKKGDYVSTGRRYWRKLLFAKQRLGNPLENEQERDLRFTVIGLNKIYADYNWKPIDEPITFIRSSQFAETELKQFHLDSWHYLAPVGVDVLVVPGTHLGLFAPPEVTGLAATISQCLVKNSVSTGH